MFFRLLRSINIPAKGTVKRYAAKKKNSRTPTAVPLSVVLNTQMRKATAVMLEAIPETIWPSQIMKRPLIPFGRRKEKFNVRIAVSISQRIRDDNPQNGLFSCNVISNEAGFRKP